MEHMKEWTIGTAGSVVGVLGLLALVATSIDNKNPASSDSGLRRQLQGLESFEATLPEPTRLRIQEDGSAQKQAFDWLAAHPDLDGLENWRKTQLFAMATIHYSLDGPNWIREPVWGPGDPSNWLNHSHPECEWDSDWSGVCNTDGQLLTLDLDYLKSTATGLAMPPEVGLLTNLVRLSYHVDMEMSMEDLLPVETFDLPSLKKISLLSWGGTLPSNIGNLASSLESLSIYHNYLLDNNGASLSAVSYGALPVELGDCTNLMDLTLHEITFTGTLPTQLGNLNQVTRLALVGTKAVGTVPSELGQLTRLRQVSIEGNPYLTGNLPSQLGLLAKLSQVEIKSNPGLTGPIPSGLVALTGLQLLDLSDNALESSLPKEIGNATKLRRIQLGGNQLEGPLPSELATLKRLSDLQLQSNTFNASLPSELGLLTKLQHFNASYNDITGLPTELGLMDGIQAFDMSHNLLEGDLPMELLTIGPAAGRNSWELDLSHNQLSGELSGNAVLGLSRLVKLNLRNNQLQGAIPTQFGLLSGMTTLDLGSNSFVSDLPSELGQLDRLTYLDLSNIAGLTGPIPSQIAQMTSLMDLHLSNSGFNGALPIELGDLVLLHNLHFMDVTGNEGLFGEIPEGLCELNANQTYCTYRESCTFEYECGALCGCQKDSCFCNNVQIERNGGPFD